MALLIMKQSVKEILVLIDGIIHDLKYNGNAKTYLNAGRYYEGTQSLINGLEQQTAAVLTQ